ncbi:MAG: hypothetical protein OHK0052_20290 [Anaerolineales bacterium]
MSSEQIFRKLLVSILAATTFTLLLTNLALSWIYTSALMYPGCPKPIALPAGLPQPEEHFLETSEGARLRMWYYPSANHAAILVLPGLGGGLGSSYPPIAPLLQNGYSILQIETRACATPRIPVTLGARETQDASAALDFLLTRPEIDPQRIGVYGFSLGGATAIRLAARRPEIAATLAEGGFYNAGRDLTNADFAEPLPRRALLYTIALTFWLRTGANPWQLSPVDDAAQISPRPLLLIYGEHELNSGRGDLQYAAAHEPKQLWIVPNGTHGGNARAAPQEYPARVLQFFNQWLVEP